MTAEQVDTEPIGSKAGRGLRWSLVGTTLTKIGTFGLGVALARLLTPEDYGVYAVGLGALLLLTNINDLGLIAATQQWRGKVATMAPTATTLAATSSVLLYGGFWLAAPVIAGTAGIPDAAPVLRLLAVIILVDGITAVRAGVLMREFRQDRLIVANLLGLVANAAVAITLALSGAGPFSFAGGQVSGALLTGIVVFAAAGVPVRVGLDPAVARKLLRYGLPLTASLGVEGLLLGAHYVVIGRFTDETELGYFLKAFEISTWSVSVISTAIGYVSVASFSRLSERNTEALSAGVQRTVPLLFAAAVPVGVLTAVLATPLVTVVYGAQWEPSAPVLRILLILTVVRMLTAFSLEILAGAGATRATLWVNLGWAAALLPALVLGTTWDGIRGASAAHSLVGLLVATPLVLLALHRAGVVLAPIAPALVRPLLGGACAAAVTLLVAWPTAGSPLLQLALAGTAGLAAYAAVGVSRAQRQEVRLLLFRKDTNG